MLSLFHWTKFLNILFIKSVKFWQLFLIASHYEMEIILIDHYIVPGTALDTSKSFQVSLFLLERWEAWETEML